jgi:teichuronic acid biosynthesis glycosyltransferase TuaG
MKRSAIEVSIITPAFNCKETILSTYESIKKQSFHSWEWIVVEDHSSDESFDYIKSIINDDDRVILLRTDCNSGAAAARNIGIKAANGRYISFLDADDLWMPNKLELQIGYMKDNNYELSCTNYQLLFGDGTVKEFELKKDIIDYKMLLKSNYLGCLTVIYDSKKIGKVFMPTDCEKREDYGAWLDITKKGIVAHRLNQSLSIYRIGSYSVSANKFKMVKYQYRVYRKHEKFGVIKSFWYVLVCSLNKLFRKY